MTFSSEFHQIRRLMCVKLIRLSNLQTLTDSDYYFWNNLTILV